MELKDKLKILRTARNLTQEEMAEYLGISAQTVSKWERGLSAPDIMLLPKIALLCQCSIDSLFDMDSMWGREHQRSFEKNWIRCTSSRIGKASMPSLCVKLS